MDRSSRSPVRTYRGGATDSVLRRGWFSVLGHVGCTLTSR